jgi:hypothetical protein
VFSINYDLRYLFLNHQVLTKQKAHHYRHSVVSQFAGAVELVETGKTKGQV